MSIQDVRIVSNIRTPDDQQIPVIRKDLSGGINDRQYGSSISENQMTVLYNSDIGVAGQSSKRSGSVLIGNDVGANTILGLHNFEVQGATDQLLAYEGTKVWKWLGTGNWADLGHTFSATTEVGMINAKESGLAPDDVVIIQNGVDNAHRLDSDGNFEDLGSTTYYSIPKSTVMCWYGNRVWVLLNDLLYYSDAYPSSYAPESAVITGDINVFTGVADDVLKVTIDGTVYDDIDISSATSIADVVTAINTATGGAEATSPDDYLVITSTTKGAASTVSIADGTAIGKTAAIITGDKATFTGTAGDTINVAIDSVYYYNIDIASATSIANVATAINGAAGSTVASVDGSGYLVLTSPTTGTTSNAYIADGYATAQTVIAKLFSVVADRYDIGTVNTVVDRLFSDDQDTIPPRTDTGNSPFDTVSNVFRIPVGTERGLCSTRDAGIVIMGSEGIWGLAPSVVPAATDKPEPLITNHGVVSKGGWCQAGDDIYYFAQDGFRALKRTLQDKLQSGVEFPISYSLKDEYDRISWAYIDRLSMKYFDNKIFINVPTGAASFDTWVYYTALKSFVIFQGWSPRCWETYKVGGKEYLYYGKQGDGTVYRAMYGFSDEGTTTTNGTAINYQEEGRKEDLGQPLVKKVGGIVRIKAVSSGDYNLDVSVSIDDQAYVLLGTINLQGNAPTLPVNLPFTLASGNIITKEYHLDGLGEFDQIRLKIQHNAANGSDEIIILERQFISYAANYQDEV